MSKGGRAGQGTMANADSAVGSIQDARREMYRHQILTAAEVEFSRTGFAGTKVNAIAQAAGLSLATVYKHFAGKAEIWDALHAERMDALLARIDAESVRSGPALERILSSIASVARFLTDHDSYLDMSLWAGVGWASSHPAAYGVQQTVWSAGLDTIAVGIEAAVAQGEIRAIRPRVAAGLIVSSLQVWLADWADSGRTEDPAVLVDDLITRLRWMITGPDPTSGS